MRDRKMRTQGNLPLSSVADGGRCPVFAGKDSTQKSSFNTFNALWTQNKNHLFRQTAPRGDVKDLEDA